MKLDIELDIKGWEEFQTKATGQDLEKVMQSALRKVGNQLKKATYKSFASLKTKYPTRYHRKGKGWRTQKGSLGDHLYTKNGANDILKLVKVRVLRRSREPTVSVNLYGSFLGMMFEGGTTDRYVNRSRKIKAGAPKSRYRGRIIKGGYFERAISGFEGKTAKAVEEALEKSIKTWLKKQ